MADFELDPAFVRAIEDAHAAFTLAFTRLVGVQALMCRDILSGQPTREIPHYLRELGVEPAPATDKGASDAR